MKARTTATARLSALTAGKTAKRQRKITVTIGGKQYRLLERTAKAMNSVRGRWCGTDNTAKSVFFAFVWPFAETLLHDRTELAACISSGIATGENGLSAPEPLNGLRLAALEAAFDRFGLTTPETVGIYGRDYTNKT